MNRIITYELLFSLTIILGITSISVVLLAMGNRFINSLKENFQNECKKELLPLIFRYLEGEAPKKEIISYLNDEWYTANVFQNILHELIEDLKGSYKQQLQDLLKIDLLFNTYQNYLSSFWEYKKINALDYFRHFNSLPHEIAEQLWKYVERKSFILAHASTSVLMRCNDVNVRMKAVEKYVQRADATLQSFIEILHEYHRPELDQIEKESKLVSTLLFREDLMTNLKIALLRCVPKFGYVKKSDTLHSYLIILTKEQGDPKVIAECIRSLGKLYYITAAPIIRELSAKSPNSSIRKACAFALGKFGTQKDLQEIVPLLLDDSYEVRYEAAESLTKAKGKFNELLEHLADNQIMSNENIFFEVSREAEEVQSHLFGIS